MYLVQQIAKYLSIILFGYQALRAGQGLPVKHLSKQYTTLADAEESLEIDHVRGSIGIVTLLYQQVALHVLQL
jgi:hypothetical protein